MRQRLLSRVLAPAVLVAGVGLAVPAATLATAPAAQATQPQICTNISWCLDAWGGGPSVRAYSPGATHEDFIPDLLTRCSNGFHVTAICPFTVGLGLNNRFLGDDIFQLLDNESGACVGGTGVAALTFCNYTSAGTGGGTGTVFVGDLESGNNLYAVINVHASDVLNSYENYAMLNTNGGDGAAVVVNARTAFFWSSTIPGL